VLVAGLGKSDSKVWNHPWIVPQFGIAVLWKLDNSRRMAPAFGRVKSHVSCSSTIFWDLVIGVALACAITITIGLPNSRDSLVECSPGAGLRFLNPLILGLAHFKKIQNIEDELKNWV